MMQSSFTSIFLAAILVLSTSEAFVIEKPFTALCGRNLSLAEPNESLKVDFNIPLSKELQSSLAASNCTSFIAWNGSPDFKLLPYTARSPAPPAAGVSSEPQVVLSITDTQGRLLKLTMLGSKPFYLSITPVVRKASSVIIQEQEPNQEQKQASSSPHVVLKSASAAAAKGEGGAEIEIEPRQGKTASEEAPTNLPPTIIIKRCPEGYVACGLSECIHSQFACDSVAQCATDELACFDMPSDAFLLLSFTGVMFTFALVSLVLALYVYLRFYSRHQPAFLLSADYKPTYYGTAVNGSFIGSTGCANGASGSSSSSLSSSSSSSLLQQEKRQSRRAQQLYERNIQLQQQQKLLKK